MLKIRTYLLEYVNWGRTDDTSIYAKRRTMVDKTLDRKLTLPNADPANNRNGLAAPLKIYPGMTNTTSKSKPLWKHKISQQ
jgi:hypothetical protein